MIPDPNPTLLILMILGATTFILIIFLPALLELKKPKDAGPRIIMEGIAASGSQATTNSLDKIEEECESNKALLRRLAEIIAVLPNLEV
jgi:hypothetical protein